MPEQWEAEIFDHDTNTITHEFIAEIDVEQGKWYKCKVCFNQKESDGRFSCRTAFSSESITGQRGHMGTKSHLDRANAQKPTETASTLKGFLKAAPQISSESTPTAKPMQPASTAMSSDGTEVKETVVVEPSKNKPKIECQGLGWERDDPSWLLCYRAYLMYVEEGEKASSTVTVQKLCSKFVAFLV